MVVVNSKRPWYDPGKPSKVFLVLLLSLGGLFNDIMAQTSQPVEPGKEERAVAAAVESLRKAMIDPDKATLEKLTLPELSYGHSSGAIQNQAAFIETLVSGKSDFVSIVLSEQTIGVVGYTAVVRHILTAETNDGGKPGQVKLSVLLVWLKEHGAWRLLARQAVKWQVSQP